MNYEKKIKTFNKVICESLNAKQKESYNFQKASGILTEYGFTAILFHDDRQGADCFAFYTCLLISLRPLEVVSRDIFRLLPQ